MRIRRVFVEYDGVERIGWAVSGKYYTAKGIKLLETLKRYFHMSKFYKNFDFEGY